MFKSILKCLNLNSKNFLLSSSNTSSKYMKFDKTILKHVSNNPQSKVNRENREMEKIENFWNKVEQDEIRRRGIASDVEKRYDEPTIQIGKDARDEFLNSKSFIESYYIPLTNDDVKLLEHFSNDAADMIKTGGRLVLINEINFYNKSKPLDKQIKFDPGFEPLELKEVEELKIEFKEIFDKEEIFNFILQKGKSLFKDLKNLKYSIIENHKNFTEKLSYLDDYNEAMISIPFNTKITSNFERQEDPKYVKLFLDNAKFDENATTNKLKEIYFNYYNAIVDSYKQKREKKLNPDIQEKAGLNTLLDQVEINLLKRTYTYVDYLINHGMKAEFVKDTSKSDFEENSYIFEKLFIKGVSLDRSQNYEPDEYLLIDSHENLGIRYFLHKALLGERSKLDKDLNSLTDGSKIADSNYINSVFYKVSEGNRKIVLRAYLLIKHPYKFLTDKLDYPADYSYNHLAVFENEIEAPHHTALMNFNFENYLKKHKLNLEDWRLVDIDNFMKGNSFFVPKSPVLKCRESVLSIENSIETFIEESFGISEFKSEARPTVQIETKPNEGLVKKDKKKKEKKEENTKEKEEISNNDIPQMQFNYKIIKFKRENKFIIGTPEDNAEILKQIEMHKKKQLAKDENKIKQNLEKLENFEKEIEVDFNAADKLESLVRLNNSMKKEIKNISYEPINLNPFLESDSLLNKTVKTDFDKLVNKLIVKHVTKWNEGENLY